MKTKNQIQQKVGVKGEVTARFYNQSTLNLFQRKYNKLVKWLAKNNRGLMKHYILGELQRTDVKTNLICNIGFEAVCKRLAGTLTYTGEITKMALGTGTGSAAVGDTTLETEAYRNDSASGTASSNVAYITAYFTETECSGTYKEFGNFIDGAAGADTGQLWSHITGLTWVKDAVTAVVVDCKYTFASV